MAMLATAAVYCLHAMDVGGL